MLLLPSDIEGRRIELLGISGYAGTSINLATVQVNVLVKFGRPSIPLFLYMTRYSTGAAKVPAYTFACGVIVGTVANNWLSAISPTLKGPITIHYPAAGTASITCAQNTTFGIQITGGAAGTCDAVLYGLVL
jgi:spore coat protein U-like protein